MIASNHSSRRPRAALTAAGTAPVDVQPATLEPPLTPPWWSKTSPSYWQVAQTPEHVDPVAVGLEPLILGQGVELPGDRPLEHGRGA